MLVKIITVITGSGPHETSPHHAESANVHQQGELHDLEHGNNIDNQQEGSLQTLHTGGSGYRRRSHLVHEQADENDLQREIDDLKRDFVEHNENKPLPALMFLPMTTKMPVTGNDQKLHLVSLITVKRNILAKGSEGVYLGEG